MRRWLNGCSPLPLVIGLPTIDLLLVIRMIYIASVPDLLSPFWAVAIGCVLAVVVFAVFIAGQGNTVLEIIVPSFILFVLLVFLYPVASRMPAIRHANLQKRALKEQRERASQRTGNSVTH